MKYIIEKLYPVALIIIIFWSVRSCSNHRESAKVVQKNLEVKEQQLESFKNRNGKLQYSLSVAQGSVKELQVTHQKELDELEKEFNIKLKNLESALRIGAETKLEIRIERDTVEVEGESFDFDRENLTFKFTQENYWYSVSGFATQNSVDLNLAVYDRYDVVTSWKRKRFYSRPELQVEVISQNPFTQVTGLNSISIDKPKRGRFAIGPTLGFGVGSDIGIQPFIGVGVTYGIIFL